MTKRTIEEINAIRVPLGFPERKKAVSKSKPRPAILPESKKAQAQAVLAKMLEDQMACLKLVADRIIPASYFDLDKTKNKSSGVTIQILGVGETTINSSPNEEEDEYIEGELVDE
jgi:hypothetical protein